jgi:hypothetical protein
MRTRKRAAILAASAAALGVGLIAFPGSAGAVVPNCTPPITPTNDSCVKGVISPSALGGTFKDVRLFARTRTNFTSPGNTSAGGRAKTVTLDFDNDGRLNFGTVPTCSTSALTGKSVAQAWNTCGPGAGASKNAYLSTEVAPTGFGCNANPCVSGQARAYPTVNACTLVFNGPVNTSGQHTTTLFARAPVSPTACAQNPSTITGGTTTVVLKGTVSTSPLAGYGPRLTVPNVDTAPLPLIDFYAYVKRGSFFQARCPAGASPLKVRGLWQYSGGPPSPEPSDTSVSTQACS